MVIERRFCRNHPERPAIGVCVMTQQAICGECSTRYEGVNYSREGLSLLKSRRAQERAKHRAWPNVALLVLSPVLLLLVYWSYYTLAVTLISLTHWE